MCAQFVCCVFMAQIVPVLYTVLALICHFLPYNGIHLSQTYSVKVCFTCYKQGMFLRITSFTVSLVFQIHLNTFSLFFCVGHAVALNQPMTMQGFPRASSLESISYSEDLGVMLLLSLFLHQISNVLLVYSSTTNYTTSL